MTATHSGYAYQLRYAVWRATWIAAGRDPLSGRARAVRVEYPLRDRHGSMQSVDVVIEDADGHPLELIEAKEHDGFLPPASLSSFVTRAEAMRTAVPPATRFRFVSNQKLAKGLNLARPEERLTALQRLGLAALDGPDVEWELGTGSQMTLLARTLVLLANDTGNARDVYCRIFAQAHAELARRRPQDADVLRQVEEELLAEFFSGRNRLPAMRGDARLDIEELRETMARLDRERPDVHERARRKVTRALRRQLFDDEKVTTEQIFVDPNAYLLSPQRRHSSSTTAAMDLLLRWYTELREGRESRLPLLLIGTFGLGKSTLLTMFAHKLFELSEWVTPLLVPLRDLAGVDDEGFRPAFDRHVREQYGLDLSRPPEEGLRYLFLCDGFDELNLYYSRVDAADWAEKAFGALAAVASRPDAGMIISSRPLVSLARRESQPQVELTYFSPAHIEQWCANYRRARPEVDAGFQYETLQKRGLAEIAATPIILYMIALLYEDHYLTREHYTRTDVFRTFIDWTESGGYARHGKGERKHRLPENYREILQDIAWLLFRSPAGHMPERDLVRELQKTHGKVTRDAILVGTNLLVAHMLQPAAGSKGSARLIEFTHQSFREYLVAERLWRALAPVRDGSAEGRTVWAAIGSGFFTTAETEFLRDMVRATPAGEARRLYDELDWGEHVGAYFQEPLWSSLPDPTDDDSAEEDIAARLVLAFVLRLELYRYLEATVRRRELPPPPSDRSFREILDFLSAAQQDGMRELLLANLTGLRLGAEAELSCLELADAEMQDLRLVSANLQRSVLVGCNIEDSRFRLCNFSRASLASQYLVRTKFLDCSFAAAEIHIENELELGTTWYNDFTGSDFTAAVFTGLVVRHNRFLRNIWSGARLNAEDEVVLDRCTLDENAERFFRRAGAKLSRCRIV